MHQRRSMTRSDPILSLLSKACTPECRGRTVYSLKLIVEAVTLIEEQHLSDLLLLV